MTTNVVVRRQMVKGQCSIYDRHGYLFMLPCLHQLWESEIASYPVRVRDTFPENKTAEAWN